METNKNFPTRKNAGTTPRSHWTTGLCLLLYLVILLGPVKSLQAATYYLDAVNGNNSNSGTTTSPWETVAKAQSVVSNGDTVYLYDGNYGEVRINRSNLTRNSWSDGVTYEAENGYSPIFDSLVISGNENRYLTFKGINVTSQNTLLALVLIKDSSHVKIIDCNISGTWVPDGDRAAVTYNVSYGVLMDGASNGIYDILVDSCDIQGVDRGIKFYHDIRDGIIARNNHIHITGQSFIVTNTIHNNGEILIENNHLHDRRRTPSAHGSGIAVRDSHITIRGNQIHDFGGSGGIRFYGYPPVDYPHEDILIENNLVYDAQGVTNLSFGAIKKNITVRNNTFIGWNNGSSITNKYGTVAAFSPASGQTTQDVFVYNNIFVGLVGITAFSNFVEYNNIFWAVKYEGNYLNSPLGANSVIVHGGSGLNSGYDANYFEGSGNFFAGGALFDQYAFAPRSAGEHHKQNLNDAYRLAVGSDAIGFGDPAQAPATDLLGNPRDANPDAGAYEFGASTQPGAPVLASIGNKSVGENQNLTFTISASDPDGDPISYSIQNEPAGSSFTNQTFSWTPTHNEAGTYQVTFSASDGLLQDSETITITAGSAPVIDSLANQSVNENDLLSFTVNGSDADGNLLTFSATGLPQGATFDTTTRLFSWTPATGQAGNYSVIFNVSDGAFIDSKTITIVVNPPLPPDGAWTSSTTWQNQAISTQTGQFTLEFDSVPQAGNIDGLTGLASGAANDYDDLAVTVRFFINGLIDAINGGIYSADNNIAYQPGLNYHFRLVIDIPNHVYDIYVTPQGTAEQLIGSGYGFRTTQNAVTTLNDIALAPGGPHFVENIQIIPIDSESNQAPSLNTIGNKTATENSPLNFSISATDPDNDPITYSASNLPTGATFNSQTFDWTPGNGQAGTYQVTFTANDGQATDSETITITVALPPNNPPVLAPIGNQAVTQNILLTFIVNATDPDADTLIYSVTNLPTGATFNNQVFSWTPTSSQVGQHNLTFSVNDGESQDSETITITVALPPNQPPVIAPIADKTTDENQPLAFAVNATDPDGDNVLLTVSNFPMGTSFMNNNFTWTPDYNDAGIYNVTFTASDGTLQDSATVTITVNNTNRPPTLQTIPDQYAALYQQLSFSINVADPDGDPLTVSAFNLPTGASFVDKYFTWTPQQISGQPIQVTFTASDGSLQQTTTVYIFTLAANTDVNPPIVTSTSPNDQTIQVSLNSLVTLELTDTDSGLDPNSLLIQLAHVFPLDPYGSATTIATIYAKNTDLYQSDLGQCRRTGSNTRSSYIFQPNPIFENDQTIQITVHAKDLAGNTMPTHTFTFTTEMDTFSAAVPVNTDSSLTPGDHPRAVFDHQNNLYVAWHTGPVGARNILVAKKPADASAFAPPTLIDQNSSDQCHPALTVGPDNTVTLTWQDNLNENWDIYLSQCTDGQNWSVSKRVSDSDSDQTYPAVAADPLNPDKLYIAWQDNQNTNPDIRLAVLTNALNTIVEKTITSDTAPQLEPQLAVTHNGAYLVWTDMRNQLASLYGAAENDNWINRPLVNTLSNQTQPTLVTDAPTDTLHFAWTDDRNGHNDIFYANSIGLPNAPLTGINLIDDSTTQNQHHPALALAGSGTTAHAYLAWQDHRNAVPLKPDIDIYFARLDKNARTNILVTTESSGADQSSPAITADQNGIPYITWVDSQNAQPDIYYTIATHIDSQPLATNDISSQLGGLVGTPFDQIQSPDDVSAEVPPNALWSDLTLTITRIENPPTDNDFTNILAAYEFGPSSPLEFAQPITLTIPYEVSIPPVNTDIFWYNTQAGQLSQIGLMDIEHLVITPTLHAIRFKTTHFSLFMIGQIFSSSSSGGGGGGGGGGGCSLARFSNTPTSPIDPVTPGLFLAAVLILIKTSDFRRRKKTRTPSG